MPNSVVQCPHIHETLSPRSCHHSTNYRLGTIFSNFPSNYILHSFTLRELEHAVWDVQHAVPHLLQVNPLMCVQIASDSARKLYSFPTRFTISQRKIRSNHSMPSLTKILSAFPEGWFKEFFSIGYMLDNCENWKFVHSNTIIDIWNKISGGPKASIIMLASSILYPNYTQIFGYPFSHVVQWRRGHCQIHVRFCALKCTKHDVDSHSRSPKEIQTLCQMIKNRLNYFISNL